MERQAVVAIAAQQIQPNIPAQQAGGIGVHQQIAQAIQSAAVKTGVNFAYLLNKAQQESSFDPNAKASTSTATGLFQFTKQTWLHEIKTHGAQYGLGDYADHINIDSNGAAHVNDPVWRRAILDLRKDPQVSAEMAGELDKENGTSLRANVGGKIGSTELYLAHFLGAGGASDFLKTMRADPNAKAADILPDAAAANSSVFYGADGQPRSVGQIYKHFAQKFDGPLNQATKVLMASASSPPVSTSLPAQIPAHAMPSYAMADAGHTISGPTYTPHITGNITPDSSSLFATMVLAQMNKSDLASAKIHGGNEHDRKNAISILGALA